MRDLSHVFDTSLQMPLESQPGSTVATPSLSPSLISTAEWEQELASSPPANSAVHTSRPFPSASVTSRQNEQPSILNSHYLSPIPSSPSQKSVTAPLNAPDYLSQRTLPPEPAFPFPSSMCPVIIHLRESLLISGVTAPCHCSQTYNAKWKINSF